MHEQWSKLRKNLTTQYIFVVTNATDTFHTQIRLPLWGIWSMSILLFFVIVGLTWLGISYTPLRNTIPGYPTQAYIEKQKRLIKQVTEAQALLEQHTLFMQEVKKSLPPSQVTWGIPSPYIPKWMLPTECPISQKLQPSRGHWGIDMSCPEGTPVLSPIDGTVIWIENGLYGGYTLAVQSHNGTCMVFKHLSRIFKMPGERVVASEVIALTGNTGSQSRGPHLHWEVWQNGEALDPTEGKLDPTEGKIVAP